MKLRPMILAVTAALTFTGTAQAADYSATLGGAALKFEWDGGPGNSIIGDSTLDPVAPCGPAHDCDNFLVKTDDAGQLTVAISGTSDGNVDTDIYLYESDASGKQGKALGEGVSFSPEDSVSAKAKAGSYYLAVISYRTAIAATYKGTATLKPSAAPAPTPGGPSTGGGSSDAPPSVAIGKVRSKKVKSFSGTASDDKGVSGVEVGLLQKKGSKCRSMNAKGKWGKPGSCSEPTWLAAKGTTKWSFKLRKALKKGSYVIAARSTDSAGNKSQALFKKFKAKG